MTNRRTLTDQEKEEDYEFHLHISTFTSEDSSTMEHNPLQIENAPTEQQSMVLTEQNTMVPTQQHQEEKQIQRN